MNILVSGGARYIGSHTVKALLEHGYKAVVLDNLVTGHRQSVPPDVPFYQGDIADSRLVHDIAEHMQISSGMKSGFYNVGSGSGYSVREVIDMARKVRWQTIPIITSPRRPGDPPELVANVERIQNVLGWTPKYSSLEQNHRKCLGLAFKTWTTRTNAMSIGLY